MMDSDFCNASASSGRSRSSSSKVAGEKNCWFFVFRTRAILNLTSLKTRPSEGPMGLMPFLM